LAEVQIYKRVPNTTAVELAGLAPALRLQAGKGEPPVFIQHGKLWAEGGQELATPPAWFWDEAAKVSPDAAAECGLDQIER
jgi:hypothetical protein